MKNYVLLIIMSLLYSCSQNEIISNDENENNTEIDYYFLSFDITCFSDGIHKPIFCKVYVFDSKTKERLVSGSTLPSDGSYHGINSFTEDQSIRLEFFDFSGNCIDYFGCINGGPGLSPINTPLIFKKKDEPDNFNIYGTGQGVFSMGDCNNITPIYDDVWGLKK